MKQPTFCGRELLPLSVIEAARAGDPLAVERVLWYYEGYMDKLCSGAAPLRTAESGQHPAGTAICRTGGNPEAGLWKTQPYLPKILRSGSKHRLQEIRLWNARGLKTALHKYDNQSS